MSSPSSMNLLGSSSMNPFDSSSTNLLKLPLPQMSNTNDDNMVGVDASQSEINLSPKRKREVKLRSEVWKHFTKLEQKPGKNEEISSESAFSTGGRILSKFRSSLLPSTVEALICTQDWIRGEPILNEFDDEHDVAFGGITS